MPQTDVVVIAVGLGLSVLVIVSLSLDVTELKRRVGALETRLLAQETASNAHKRLPF